MQVSKGLLAVRAPRRPEETEAEFLQREKEYLQKVKENEAKLRADRAKVRAWRRH